MSIANCITDRQFKSVCTTRLATLRWTNSSPGSRPTISFAGTRLSEHPIHRKAGACCPESLAKKSGSCRRMRSDHARLLSNRCRSVRIAFRASVTFATDRRTGAADEKIEVDTLVGLLHRAAVELHPAARGMWRWRLPPRTSAREHVVRD